MKFIRDLENLNLPSDLPEINPFNVILESSIEVSGMKNWGQVLDRHAGLLYEVQADIDPNLIEGIKIQNLLPAVINGLNVTEFHRRLGSQKSVECITIFADTVRRQERLVQFYNILEVTPPEIIESNSKLTKFIFDQYSLIYNKIPYCNVPEIINSLKGAIDNVSRSVLNLRSTSSLIATHKSRYLLNRYIDSAADLNKVLYSLCVDLRDGYTYTGHSILHHPRHEAELFITTRGRETEFVFATLGISPIESYHIISISSSKFRLGRSQPPQLILNPDGKILMDENYIPIVDDYNYEIFDAGGNNVGINAISMIR